MEEEDKQKIYENCFYSFDSLKYILEIKFGNLVRDIQYGIVPGINEDGLVDLEGDMYFDMDCPDPDLTSVTLRLKNLDSILNDVLSTYYFTNEGNLVKHKEDTTLMGISHMLSKLEYDPFDEVMKIYLNILFFDV
jgi:hypothetical protein